MNGNGKIKFYGMDGSSLIDIENNSTEKLDDLKEVKTSENFNRALKSVMEKDINILKSKLTSTIKDIKKRCAKCDYFDLDQIDDNIKSIEFIITQVENIISDLIIKKDGIKVGLFSSNKKAKKDQIKKLEDTIIYISNRQNEIIGIKNEYDKLISRNENITGLDFEEVNEKKEKKEDPLERTINFYMAKQG